MRHGHKHGTQIQYETDSWAQKIIIIRRRGHEDITAYFHHMSIFSIPSKSITSRTCFIRSRRKEKKILMI